MSDPDIVQSERDEEPLATWWERVHALDSKLYLAGYEADNIFDRLEVADLLRPNLVVLNIGVGFGYCTRALAEIGCDTHALDISHVALARVKDIAVTWHVSQLGELPASHFDLVLSHLVTQHMNDEDLRRQFQAVILALKPDGVFAMQFASPVDVRVSDMSRAKAKSGWILRTPERLGDMVRDDGGEVVRMSLRQHFSDVDWYVAHIKKG